MATTVAVTLPKLTASLETAFTVTQLRQFVTSGLPDAVLQTFLDAAMEAIDDALGPLTAHERQRPHGDLLMLGREAASITSVVEGWAALTLAADDFELSDSGLTLRRLQDGTNPSWYWRGPVDVTYVREDDAASRIRVAVALVNLDLTYSPGLASQTIGTWSEAYRQDKPYAAQRAEILASLNDEGVGIR